MQLIRRLRRFQRVLAHCSPLALAFLSISILIAADGKRVLTAEDEIWLSSGWTTIPKWNGALMVGVDNAHSGAPVLYTIDRNARREELLITVPEAARLNVVDWFISPRGEAALAGSAYAADAKYSTFVTRVSPGGESQIVTGTWPFAPFAVAIASDRSLWVAGRLKDDQNTKTIAEPVIRRYAASGALLSSTTLNARGRRPVEASVMVASRDRVGWLSQNGEYIEFSLNGQETARYDAPEGLSGIALSEENELVAGRFDGDVREFVFLDRSSRAWVPAVLSRQDTPSWARVLGFDGRTVITTTRNGTIRPYQQKEVQSPDRPQ